MQPHFDPVFWGLPDLDSHFPSKNKLTCQYLLDIAMAEIESVVEPHSVGNDIWRKPMAFIGIHGAPVSGWCVRLSPAP
jgi:hypothetical protein